MRLDDENKKICEVCKKEKSLDNFTYQSKRNYRRKICKKCVSMGLKIQKGEAGQTKVCRACGVEKSVKEFHQQKGIGDGFIARCKRCKTLGNLIPKDKKEKAEFRPLTLAAPTREDYRTMYLMLQKMGYDLNKDLHIQFSERYNIKANNPKQKFRHHISQKDLDLI